MPRVTIARSQLSSNLNQKELILSPTGTKHDRKYSEVVWLHYGRIVYREIRRNLRRQRVVTPSSFVKVQEISLFILCRTQSNTNPDPEADPSAVLFGFGIGQR